ncbi:MAG TPA: DUF222 domain-containing protein [Dermatophilaceae bacterium]|nr:DUF222 domain-containing protein [Dermatophilaceae bacterium]
MIDAMREALATCQATFRDARIGWADASAADLLDLAAAAQSVISAATAVQTLAVAGFAATEPAAFHVDQVEVTHPLGYVEEFAADELGPRLGLSPRAARERMHLAAVLASRLPRTLGLLADAAIDPWRAQLVATELSGTSPATCAAVEDALWARGTTLTAAALRARVRRELERADPAAVRRSAAKARTDRYVRTYPHELPGLTRWEAVLPADASASCRAAIEEQARATAMLDPALTLEQARADALVDLILGNATVTTTAHLTIPVRVDPDIPMHHSTGGEASRDVTPPAAPAGEPDAGGATGSSWWNPRPGDPQLHWSHPYRQAATAADRVDPATQAAARRLGLVPTWVIGTVARGGSDEGNDEDDGTGDWFATGLPGLPYARLGWAWPAEGQESGCLEEAPAQGIVAGETADMARTTPPTLAGVRARGPDGGDPAGAPRPAPPEDRVTPPERDAGVFADCTVPGIGTIPADAVAAIVGRFDTRIHRVLFDRATGTTVESGADTYRPPVALRRFVEVRDGHCRFPGCTRPARRCELDHVVRYPDGPTTGANLIALCKHHHRAKHEAGWAVVLHPDGRATWTDPHGRSHTTHPVDHRSRC